MTPNKDDIKKWLRDIGKDRKWLAEQCDVSISTVNSWLSTDRGVAAKAVLMIQRMMNEAEPFKADLQPLPDLDSRGRMELRLDYETQLKVEKEALRLGMELSAYCTEAVEWCCSQPDIGARLAARLAAKRAATPAPDTALDIPTTFTGTGTHLQTPKTAPQPDAAQDKPSPQ